ncbi:putative ABC transport system ATP-binding protein [Carnobacterium iners]|uniref:Putative hemin import ATP-binding protein HrtA n=1 Tax=Carnobacterium iners TaxID=1073423 RepID=A0A1X7N1X9_9LACT|nr:ABC transporter ATP-binding protein [Carnobacterium iners]SEK96299.1 putative ABC transport system ATP-binding protein [Carnobacterium iners]SMH31227.1 putative ABC transport system ATP-binding protein [Carnobacterium iners]
MAGLRLKNVSKTYQEGEFETIALNDVTLAVNPGEFIAIIGPSGSGKSTFLSVSGALLQPTKGEVSINDVAISTLKEKELSKVRLEQIGFILQTSNLIPYLTVLDQLLIVKRMGGKVTAQAKKYALHLLSDLGMASKIKKFPNELSGGERQRVAIARSFMNDPELILADEPTANLDTKRANEVVQLIAQEVKSRGKAAIMVTHDERMLKYCDRIYRIEDGILSQED